MCHKALESEKHLFQIDLLAWTLNFLSDHIDAVVAAPSFAGRGPGRGLSQSEVKHVSARATHEAQRFSIGFYSRGKAKGQMRVSGGTLPSGVKPVIIVYERGQARVFGGARTMAGRPR